MKRFVLYNHLPDGGYSICKVTGRDEEREELICFSNHKNHQREIRLSYKTVNELVRLGGINILD